MAKPEKLARKQIDDQLAASGWAVQDYKQFDPSSGRGIALREAPLKSSPRDYLIRDHIATSLSVEPDDLDLSPFNQRGGLGKAHQLFGEQLPKLLDELNEALAA